MIHKIKDSRGRGFTLVELLAVIVILAIILVIAVPKVMSVIEDAKKATLESTAKMIASQAEKQMVQNTVLGSDKNITCKDITNINDVDYEDCDIVFDNNTAKVTIEGSVKFEGLYVCNGTKTSAVAQTEECTSTSFVTGASYLEGLLAEEETLNNGLVQTNAEYDGTTDDAGIRYVGTMSNVKNKVYYNCDDTDANGVSYGDNNYDYAGSCEVWRIIGVFDVSNGTTSEKRVKIINTASTFKASWDSSENNINYGAGINQWGESGSYEGADLMRLLNGYYIGKSESECKYCDGGGQATCSQTCSIESLTNANMKPLTNIAKTMIENAVWDTNAVTMPSAGLSSQYASRAYFEEKGMYGQNDGKNSCVETNGSAYPGCNDTVERTTSWTGLIGLMSVSDMLYANGWPIDQIEEYIFTISPDSDQNTAYAVGVNQGDGVNSSTVSYPNLIFPSVYLKSNVRIIDGNGNDKPYILK